MNSRLAKRLAMVVIGFLVIPINRRFDESDITVDKELNKISLDFNQIISLNLLGLGSSEFTLQFVADEQILDGEYTMYAAAPNGGMYVDLFNLTSGLASDTVRIERPEPPILTSIYSNDLIVSGILPESGTSASEIQIKILDQTYSADVTGRTFQLNLEKSLQPGTTIQAYHIQANHQSLPAETTVQEATLSFLSVPDVLRFEPITIGTGSTIAYVQEPATFIIQDTYGMGNKWRLMAKINQPLTSAKNQLPGALGFIFSDNTFTPFSEQSITVLDGITENREPQIIEWSGTPGPVIHIEDMSTIYAEEYSTTIEWTLTNAP